MARVRRLGVPFAACLLAACLGLDTGPGLTLDWEVLEGGVEEPVLATAGRASIHVQGHIPSGQPCHPLQGDVRQSGSTVRLTIRVREDLNICLGGPSTLRYVANVVNLRSGATTLLVQHEFVGLDRPDEIVFEGELTIS